MILEKLHRAINNFNKTFNWRRFRRDALHLGESLLVFGVLYGIFSTLIWGVCWLFKINYNPDLIAVAWAVPVLLDTLVNKAYGLCNYLDDGGNWHSFEGDRLLRTYVEHRPDRRFIELQSHPLLIPDKVDSWLVAEVC